MWTFFTFLLDGRFTSKYGGASIRLFEPYFKRINRPRACRRSHISRFTARPAWAQASLGGRLGAAFELMQCVSGAAGAAAGCGQPQPQRPHRHAITSKKPKFIRVRPLCRNQHEKDYLVRHSAPFPTDA